MRPRSACQIVDLYHAKEHLWDVSRALRGGNTGCVEEWAEAHCTDLVKVRLDDFLAGLRSAAADCEEARQYIECNRDRMRYAEFGTRLKWSGMH